MAGECLQHCSCNHDDAPSRGLRTCDDFELWLNDRPLAAPTFAWGALALLMLLFLAAAARGVDPLPADRRIPATITRVLTVQAEPGLHMPTDVTVDSTGTVYIADGARDRIVTLNPDGQFRSATTRPAEQQLKRPIGITVDARDQLWIADTDHHRLVVLSRDGALVQTIDVPGIEGGHSADPTDVAVTKDLSRTYIVDNPNHRVMVRDNATGQWTSLGKAGQMVGQFHNPFMLAVGSEGDVLITEALGSRVQILSARDRWAGVIGQWGVELGQMYRPKGVAVDARGRVFVGDSTLKVVQVFSPRGKPLGALTDAEGRPIHFQHPMGMCFDKQGRLYVTELKANQIAVLTIADHAGETKP